MQEIAGPAFAASATNTVTTASYTPTANAVQVAICSIANPAASTLASLTISDSVSGVWRLVSSALTGAGPSVAIYAKDAGGSPVAQTVTFTALPATMTGASIEIRQFLQAAVAAAQLGATATSGTISQTGYAIGVLPAYTNSQIVGGFARLTSAVTLTANTATSIYGQSNAAGTIAAFESTTLSVAGTLQTLGFTNTPGGANAMAAVEIIPSANGSSGSAFGQVVNQWVASFSQPWAIGSGMNANLRPPQQPLAVNLSGHNLGFGHSLICVATWRQDSGAAGFLTYPMDVTVCDDFHNYWVPVKASPPAGAGTNVGATTARNTAGIVRHAVWMAPAARGATAFPYGWWNGATNVQAPNVYVCPNGYTSAMIVQVFEVATIGPWFSIGASCVGQWNQQGTATLDPVGLYPAAVTPGSFALTVVGRDNLNWTMVIGQTGWFNPGTQTTINPTNHNSDLSQSVLFGQTGASSNDVTAGMSGGVVGLVDASILQVVIHGITDQVAFPYSQPSAFWPVLLTEMGIGAKGAVAQDQVTWTNVSQRNNSIVPNLIGRGGQFQLNSLQAGTWQLALDNYDSAFSPSNLFSGYYSSFLNSTSWNFENGTLNGWAAYGGTSTAVVSRAWSYTGNHSVLFTPDGVTSLNGITQTVPIPQDGAPYTFSMQYMSPQGSGQMSISFLITWLDASAATITTDGTAVGAGKLIPGLPSTLVMKATAPSGAASAKIQTVFTALAPASLQVYIDQIGVSPGTTSPLTGCIDTDVPIRLRSIWPYTPTPYSVLFSGYTDDVGQSQNPTLRNYIAVNAVDVWSRTTAQMASAGRQEVLIEPELASYFPLSDPAGTVTPVDVAPVPQVSNVTRVITAATGPGSQTFAFGAQTPVAMAGDSSAACFQTTGLLNAEQTAGDGHFLFLYTGSVSVTPPNVSRPFTFECWSDVTGPLNAGVPNGPMVIALAVRNEQPIWRLQWVASGANVQLQLVDSGNNTVNIGTATPAATWAANQPYYMSFSWVPGSPGPWQLVSIGWGAFSGNWDPNTSGTFLGSNTFYNTINGFECMGNLNSGLCWNGSLWGLAFHNGGWTAPMRAFSHWQTEATAAVANSAGGLGDYDVSRMSRITGYAGFPVALAASGSQADAITPATDTLGQVASSYYTNISATTLALLMVDGPGSLVYRTRADWYAGSYGQLQQPVPLNQNPGFRQGTTGWGNTTSCSIATSALHPYAGSPSSVAQTAAGGAHPTFTSFGYGFGGGGNSPVLPNQPYFGDISVVVPAGTPAGPMAMGINWSDVNGISISSTTFVFTPATLNSNQRYNIVGVPVISPAGAANAQVYLQFQGTPAAGTVAYWGMARLYDARNVTVWSLGENVGFGEVPFNQPGVLTQDRSQFFNYAYLTQFGAGSVTTNTGTGSTSTQSSSGVIITAENAPSIALRGQVPYTTSSYLDNTQYSAAHYLLGNLAIEDQGNWVVWTLGAPVQRAERIPWYPIALSRVTPNAVTMAVQGEVGDSINLARRPIGQAPTTLIRSYISQLQHTISFGALTWETQYTISPNWVAMAFALDAPSAILNGQNVLGA